MTLNPNAEDNDGENVNGEYAILEKHRDPPPADRREAYGEGHRDVGGACVVCALPAVALAHHGNTSSGNEQNAEINQGAVGGDAGNGGVGGDAGNQGAIVQQNAGDDANAEVNQEQNFGGDTVVGGDVDNGHGHGGDVDGRGHGHGGGDVTVSGGVGGGVGGVTLARTGFDAWIFALIGGALLAGGIGILAAQRRGRLSA